MSADSVSYIDSSAIVKLIVEEPESVALRRYLRGRRTLVSSALVRTEVKRAVLPLGPPVLRRVDDVLGRIELVRINNLVLNAAGLFVVAAFIDVALDIEENTRSTFRIQQQILENLESDSATPRVDATR